MNFSEWLQSELTIAKDQLAHFDTGEMAKLIGVEAASIWLTEYTDRVARIEAMLARAMSAAQAIDQTE